MDKILTAGPVNFDLSEVPEKVKRILEKQCSNEVLQDEFGLYIPSSAKLTQYSPHVFDLAGTVSDFLDSNKTVLLLLGGSGSGKSFSTKLSIKYSCAYK